MITSKPSTKEYRNGYDNIFKRGKRNAKKYKNMVENKKNKAYADKNARRLGATGSFDGLGGNAKMEKETGEERYSQRNI